MAVTRTGTTQPSLEILPASTDRVDEAIERLQLDVARAVRKVCPHWLVDQVDDLTQVATFRIVQRLRAGDGALELTPGYIYRAAYTALVDEIRRRRRLREAPIEIEGHFASQAHDPDRQAGSRIIREALISCLSKLQVSRRRAVMLHLQGHSLDETSALLESARKKTENLVYRGLAELRLCLQSRGVEP